MFLFAVLLSCLLHVALGTDKSVVKAWSLSEVSDSGGLNITAFVFDEDTGKAYVFGTQLGSFAVFATMDKHGKIENSRKIKNVVSIDAAKSHPKYESTLIIVGTALIDDVSDEHLSSIVGFLNVAEGKEPELFQHSLVGDFLDQSVPLVAVEVFSTLNMLVAVGGADNLPLPGYNVSTTNTHGSVLAAFDLRNLSSPLWTKANVFECDTHEDDYYSPPFGAVRFLKNQLIVVTQGATVRGSLPSTDVCRFQVQRTNASTVWCRKLEESMPMLIAGVHVWERTHAQGGSKLLVPGSFETSDSSEENPPCNMLAKMTLSSPENVEVEYIYNTEKEERCSGAFTASHLDADNKLLYLAGAIAFDDNADVMNPLVVKYDLSDVDTTEKLKEVHEFEQNHNTDNEIYNLRPNFVQGIVLGKNRKDLMMVAPPNTPGYDRGDGDVHIVSMKKTNCFEKKVRKEWVVDSNSHSSVQATADYFGDAELVQPTSSVDYEVATGTAQNLKTFCNENVNHHNSNGLPVYGVVLIVLSVIAVCCGGGWFGARKMCPGNVDDRYHRALLE